MPYIWVNGNGTQRRRRRRSNRSYRTSGNYRSYRRDYSDRDASEYYDNGNDRGPSDNSGWDDDRHNGLRYNGDPVRIEIASPNDMLPPRAESDQWANIRRRARF